jgi:tetratricopeptide (TPR) repeat protein
VIEIRPDFTNAYINRGNVYTDPYNAKRDLNKAISDYTKAIEIDPKDADAYFDRGLAFYYKDDFDRAIPDLAKAIEIKPGFKSAYFNRGHAYHGKGMFNEAIADYSKVLEIDPTDFETYYLRAVSYCSNKEYEKAWQDLHKAEDYGYPLEPEFLERLKKESGREK